MESNNLSKSQALLLDLLWIITLSCFGMRVLDLSPIPGWPQLVTLPLLTLALLWLQKKFIGATLGQLVWRTGNSKSALTTAIFVNFVTLAGTVWIARESLWKHPLLIPAAPESIEAVVPEKDAEVLSWFTLIGAWPKTYNGQPVSYTLPYEKGPPEQFLGHVNALWNDPLVTVRLEGPKTPAAAKDPAAVQLCLTSAWMKAQSPSGQSNVWDCLQIREAVLMRHIREMRRIYPKEWDLKWFEVKNPTIPGSEVPRGFQLTARTADRSLDRFVLVNAKGSHQAVEIERPTEGAEAEAALAAIREALGSSRNFPNLDAPKAWSRKLLSETKTGGTLPYPLLMQIQGRLFSHFSVEPRSIDTLFHLGGTTMLALTHDKGSLEASEKSLLRANLGALVRYAQDLAPTHPKTLELQDFWIKINK